MFWNCIVPIRCLVQKENTALRMYGKALLQLKRKKVKKRQKKACQKINRVVLLSSAKRNGKLEEAQIDL